MTVDPTLPKHDETIVPVRPGRIGAGAFAPPRGAEGAPSVGARLGPWLTVAGVEKPVTLNLQVRRTAAALAVTGTTDLLMTDYGVTPPKAMMGMLKTNPKVQIKIELVLEASSLS